ncbi:MAG TPA: peptide deformylase [Candidatus Paceibacterota bacterium]|nr:peptide deformylase [Candidatus Paceibacterota bacterium]
MKKILQKNEKILRLTAREVPFRQIKTAKIKKILEEMKESLKSQDDGVAIAAPQIGYSLRIFLVSGRMMKTGFSARSLGENYQSGEVKVNAIGDAEGASAKQDPEVVDMVFINPKISKLSKAKEWMPEGCLSVRPLYGKTFRSNKATVVAYDENGKKFTRGASGILAQIFQHETDHLNGILFIDHAKDISEEIPKKKN